MDLDGLETMKSDYTLQQLMQLWCASLSGRLRSYLAAEMGKKVGFDYQHPLTESQQIEIMKKIDAEMPELYQWAKVNPRPGGWIFDIEEV